jgi:RNA-directed DNA polymerase
LATAMARSSTSLTRGDLSASAESGSRQERKDEMAKGREESDGRETPKSRRKTVLTTLKEWMWGGRATTASEQTRQLELFSETADSPKGADGGADAGLPAPATYAVPKSENTKRRVESAMTMEEVAAHGNLKWAFARVEANEGAPGPDWESIEEVAKRLDELIPELSRALLEGSYQPGNIRRVWIPKPGGGQRGLGIPNVVDRLVQQAVHQVLSPQYEPTFHESSHGFRPGKSCHTAIAEAKKYLEEGYEWVVDIDLEKFFDRVNHDRLMSRLEERVKDRRLLRLIRQMLKAQVVMPDGVVVSMQEGTPQGGPLSPLLSNIVLDELDNELSQRGHRFVRYADDCNIYVRSERAGKRVMASVTNFIENRLRLKVNVTKSAVARPEERHFLGFRLRREPMDGSVEVLLSKRSKERINEKIRELTPRNFGQSLKDCIRGINAYLLGWIGFFWICTDAEVQTLHNLDAHLRRRLRALLLKQWKRRRSIAKRLIQFGVKPKTTWQGIYWGRRSWWALSHSTPVDRGLRNAYFAKRGLVSLESRWRDFQDRAVIASAPG